MPDKTIPDNTGLTADRLTLGYHKQTILEGLSVTFPKSRFTAILGPNGCGKSTLLKALARQITPRAGRVLLDGRAIASLSTKEAARQLGLLAQGSVPPEGLTIEALVRLGRYPHRGPFSPWQAVDSAAVESALIRTGLADLRNRPLEALSGGQRQRAWIAMVLAQAAPVLLLDEPTTWLDLRHQIEILGLMRQLVDDEALTVIAVLHDLDQAARHADHLVMMQAGRILAEGTVADTLRPDLLAQVFGVTVDVIPDPATGRPLCIPRGLTYSTMRNS